MSGAAGREIERVWLLRAAPEIPADLPVERWEIEQGYLEPAAGDEDGLARLGFPEGRLRRIVEPDGRARCFHTIKSGSGIVRVEHEREIGRAEFEAAWPRTSGRRLAKVRRRVRVGGLVWEIDVFRDLPLAMAEVELDDANAEVALPAWLAAVVEREVSCDPRYRNSALATYGLPRDAPRA